MRLKKFISTGFFGLFLVMCVQSAHCEETCYIDDSPLFLYKTINWWYDSLPEESGLLCGRPVKCVNDGNAEVEYDAKKGSVELHIKGGLASMVLAFKKCKQCYGPAYLKSSWLNRKYFKSGKIAIRLNDDRLIQGFTISNITKEVAQRFKHMEADLQFILEGVIGGLSDSRIVLHESGKLLKYCRVDDQEWNTAYPISLIIRRASDNAVLAKFNMIWEY